MVAIADAEETKNLAKLVEQSAKFIRRLPWAQTDSTENDGKGPFEKSLFEPPDFSSIHSELYRALEMEYVCLYGNLWHTALA